MGVRHVVGTIAEDFMENFEANLGLGWKCFGWAVILGVIMLIIHSASGLSYGFMFKWIGIIIGCILGVILSIILFVVGLAIAGWILRHVAQFIHSRFVDNRA